MLTSQPEPSTVTIKAALCSGTAVQQTRQAKSMSFECMTEFIMRCWLPLPSLQCAMAQIALLPTGDWVGRLNAPVSQVLSLGSGSYFPEKRILFSLQARNGGWQQRQQNLAKYKVAHQHELACWFMGPVSCADCRLKALFSSSHLPEFEITISLREPRDK